MPAVQQIINTRQNRRLSKSRVRSRRLGQLAIGILILFSLISSILIIAGTAVYSNYVVDIPSLENLPLLLGTADRLPYNPTKVYDRSGEHLIAVLENQAAQGNKYLTIAGDGNSRLSDELISAFIASQEPGYWNNPGFSWESISEPDRPSIAQKLAQQFFLPQGTHSTRQSIQELILAAQIISTYGHQQVLEWYINHADFGNLAFGADAASRVYFGKPAADISLAEAAFLAAIVSTPDRNPVGFPEQIYSEKNSILQNMFDQGMITANDLDDAKMQDIIIRTTPEPRIDLEPAFTNLVLDQAAQYIPLERINRGGLEIISSLDYDLYTQTACTVGVQSMRLSGKTQDGQTGTELTDCEMARLLPSTSTEHRNPDNSISTHVLIMDPRDGQILTLLVDGNKQQDQKSLSNPSPGTILTPFIYLSAFSRGFNPSTLVWDIPSMIPSGLTEISGEIDRFNGPTSLRESLANDYLIPTLQLLEQMDPQQVWRNAERLGLINLELPEVDGQYRILYEDGQVDFVELSQAYGALANQGVMAGISGLDNGGGSNPLIKPQVIIRILDETGNVILDCTDPISDCHTTKRPVTSKELAYLVTDILSDETARWPSLGHPNSLEIGRPAAAKIGASNDDAEIWTLGYTPTLLTSVWLGQKDATIASPLDPVSAGGLWHAIMQYSLRGSTLDDFVVPPSISELPVCYPSGQLPSEDCPRVVNEVFINSNQPSQIDNLFQTFAINQETGQLATIFTPPGLIEEKVFMVVPPEAKQWAEDAGIPRIPSDYDLIDIDATYTENVKIISPTMFSIIQGVIPISGYASGEGFQSYRLQVGSGLNPTAWIQIGEESQQEVSNGQLGVWDTSDLAGLYVLQLVVSYDDNQVETSIVQVTIDNESPSVIFRFPKQGQIIDSQGNDTVSILVEASDNLELDRVELFINGELVTSISAPPYVYPWELSTGQHVIRAVAYDQAGNKQIERIRIIVK